MKNGFPLNNDFKTIIMLINDNNFINKDLKTNIIDHAYKIYANSFTIMENDKKKSNNKENKYLNTLNQMNLKKTINLKITELLLKKNAVQPEVFQMQVLKYI